MLKKFFSFSGRLNRKSFWLRYLAVLLFVVLVTGAITFGFFAGAEDLDADTKGSIGSFVFVVSLLITGLVAIVSTLSLSVRRFHDRNKSGWWILLAWIVPLIAGLMSQSGNNSGEFLTGSVSLLVGLWLLIELGFLKGTDGPNRFGPDPIDNIETNPILFGREGSN